MQVILVSNQSFNKKILNQLLISVHKDRKLLNGEVSPR